MSRSPKKSNERDHKRKLSRHEGITTGLKSLNFFSAKLSEIWQRARTQFSRRHAGR